MKTFVGYKESYNLSFKDSFMLKVMSDDSDNNTVIYASSCVESIGKYFKFFCFK